MMQLPVWREEPLIISERGDGILFRLVCGLNQNLGDESSRVVLLSANWPLAIHIISQGYTVTCMHPDTGRLASMEMDFRKHVADKYTSRCQFQRLEPFDSIYPEMPECEILILDRSLHHLPYPTAFLKNAFAASSASLMLILDTTVELIEEGIEEDVGAEPEQIKSNLFCQRLCERVGFFGRDDIIDFIGRTLGQEVKICYRPPCPCGNPDCMNSAFYWVVVAQRPAAA